MRVCVFLACFPESGLSESILLIIDVKLATITLNLTDRLNFFNAAMQQELSDALDVVEKPARAVRALLITDAGRGFFGAHARVAGRIGLSLEDMNLIEVNEASAAQALAVLREPDMEVDAALVNPQGGHCHVASYGYERSTTRDYGKRPNVFVDSLATHYAPCVSVSVRALQCSPKVFSPNYS